MTTPWKEAMQGIDKGRAVTLARLLARRFGPLPSALQSRLDAAMPEQLDTWTDRLLDAPTLQAVFEPH